jgi:hypothetical protein
MKIDTDVLTVLSQAEISGKSLTLQERLDRNLYDRANRVLEAIGGWWSRKASAHIFEADPTDTIETMILTGKFPGP